MMISTYSVYFSAPWGSCIDVCNTINAFSTSTEVGSNPIAFDRHKLPNSIVGAGIADDWLSCLWKKLNSSK